MRQHHLVCAAFAAALALASASRDAHAIQFRFPVDNADGRAIWSVWVIGADHDPEPGEDRSKCLNHAGLRNFPFCYDDHGGTDFMLDGGFPRMDAGSAWILAAADGVVVRVVDGNYDRCHGDFQSFDVTCDGNPRHSNFVAVEHAGGWRTEYHHMKSGSPIVEEGDVVRCGDPLGLIGSSGFSSAPHLHFHVFDPDGETVDPYAGPKSQPESFWVEQDGPRGLPAERCEGDPPPVDVVEPSVDVVEPSVDVVEPSVDVVEPSGDVVDPPVDADEPPIDLVEGPDTGATPPADAAGRPDASSVGDASAGRDVGSGSTWEDVEFTAGRPIGCDAGGTGGAGDTSALPALLALLLGLALGRVGARRYQSSGRSPLSARVARSASARRRSRRTVSASS